MIISIQFKSAPSLRLKLREITVTRESDNTVSKIVWDGLVKPKKILYLSLSEIVHITRLD
jgi:hypothetical protein